MSFYFETYLKLSLVISIWCVGVFLASEHGKILQSLRQLVYYYSGLLARLFVKPRHTSEWYHNKISKLTDKIAAPIIGCCPCMASVHSIVIYAGYLLHHGLAVNLWNLAYLLFIIFTVTVFNTILITLVNLLRSLDFVTDRFAEQIEKEEKDEQ